MPESCARCQKSGEAPEPKRIPFGPALKEKIAASVCSSCWKEWEEMEIKVIKVEGGQPPTTEPRSKPVIESRVFALACADADEVRGPP